MGKRLALHLDPILSGLGSAEHRFWRIRLQLAVMLCVVALAACMKLARAVRNN
jgi:hypothetical protein